MGILYNIIKKYRNL